MARVKYYNSTTGQWEYADAAYGAGAAATVKPGLTVAVIGDSISTMYGLNACEMVVEEADVGVELSSYITYYDIDKTISKDGLTSGYTIAATDVGAEIKFMPCADDVGKVLGTPKNYNTAAKTQKTWWQVAAEQLGFEPIAASWSGSSITSHERDTASLRCSYAWHDHTIRKLGKRIPGTMNRTAPDVVLIYRGVNDLSHSKQVRLSADYYANVAWKYPNTDLLSSVPTYGYKEGLALTIRKIRDTYPRARIVLCACPVFKRSNYANFPTNNGNFSLPQMNDAIRETADFFGCQVIDLDKCGITFENCYDEGYITDSATTPTHPNTAGHALMGIQAVNDLLAKVGIIDVVPSFDVIEFAAGENSGAEDDGDDDAVNIAASGVVMDGYYIGSEDGALKQYTGTDKKYFVISAIPVDADAIYSAPYARNTAFYDEAGNLISHIGAGGSASAIIETPAGAVTMTVTYQHKNFASTDDVLITEG